MEPRRVGLVPGGAMTTRELIAALQAQDPSGDLPVCLSDGGEAIHFVSREPGYYDGPYERLERNERGCIVSARLTTQGEKVRLHHTSIATMIMDRPDFPVTVDVTSHRREDMDRRVEQWRAEAREL